MSRGRPSSYDPEVAATILQRLSTGEYITAITAEEGMPHHATIARWKLDHEDFRAAYARAREDQALAVAERAVAVARTTSDDKLGRLAYDAEKWMASKLDPKTYGDKVALEHSGELNTKAMTHDELRARIASLSEELAALSLPGGVEDQTA